MTLEPIGVINTPYSKAYHAPRQPAVDDRLDDCTVQLFPGPLVLQALTDLAGFERIWLLYVFDRVDHWKPMVLPPRSSAKRGVFSTRSPHRPNRIGMSVVSLRTIAGTTITVGPTDILDGTPLIDIKPYIPAIDAFPESRAGWVDETSHELYDVVWAAPCPDPTVRRHVTRILSSDPSPHPYRRTRLLEGGLGEIAVTTWRCHFTVNDHTVTIVRVFSL